ncbi:MAG TPA: alpha-galactosidase [Verrucomicrobiae bacterium]
MILLALGVWSNSQAETIPLSALDLSQMSTGWGAARPGKGVDGGTLSIAGKKYADGVGTHARSKFRLDLAANARAFEAQVGVNDSAGKQGSVEFVVTGDGQPLWSSGVMRGGEPAKPVKVDLTGIKILELLVTEGGDGAGSDHADWADARIVTKTGARAPVVLAPEEAITIATKHLTLRFQVGDDHRLYQFPLTPDGSAGKLARELESYPQAGDGYIWEPALQMVHADGNTSTALIFDHFTQTQETADIVTTRLYLRDAAYPVQVVLGYKAHQADDLIEEWTELQHAEKGSVTVQRMAASSLLVGKEAWLTHFFGDWAKEMMAPITEPLTPGTKILDSKLGVRASQYRNPSFFLSLGQPADETQGTVLAGSLAWSGSFQCEFENYGQGVRALCGVNPFASSRQLAAGKPLVTPVMLWCYSAHGLGEMSRKFHHWARDFGMRDGHTPRQVLLNNWEATGFDFDFDRIVGLYEPARQIGTELFLLDDGWFANKYPRTNDDAGLGDWQPNRQRLPHGLAPLAKAAADRGLRFGIWIEPEMVNPRSELFEQHPDWVIRQPRRELDLQRHQLVLDLTRPAVQEYEWQAIQSILTVPGITYAKWDCNRYLTQPGSPYLTAGRQGELWTDYVDALYALMDKTARTYPRTEMMLCSGGGGRADYGALRYFHEFWPSDNTDPTLRVPMQWDYSYFFPVMALASHVTHWGNRPMHFACTVAMSARFGMDLDLTKLPAADRATCTGAIAAYKEIREVTQLGELYRLEDPHQGYRGALNFVAPDQSKAVVFAFQLHAGPAAPVHPQGLDPQRQYRVHELNPANGRAPIPQEGKTISGADLMANGVWPSCANAVEASVIELAP